MAVNRRTVLETAAKAHGQSADVVMRDDPAIVRHESELFGVVADPDLSPPDTRHVPRGRVLLEWVGDTTPYHDKQIAAGVQLGVFQDMLVAAWDLHSERILYRIERMWHHTMTRERDGMSETVTWGPLPGTYVREVSAKDADVLLSGTMAHQFRVVGKIDQLPASGQPADRDPIERFVPPALRATVRAVVVEERAPENLVGVGNGGRLGAWTPTR